MDDSDDEFDQMSGGIMDSELEKVNTQSNSLLILMSSYILLVPGKYWKWIYTVKIIIV